MEVTGKTTVWVVVPVKNCWGVEVTVKVVVPAAVAVVVYPARKLLVVMFTLASRATKVEAVAPADTPEPVASPVMAGVVKAGEVMV